MIERLMAAYQNLPGWMRTLTVRIAISLVVALAASFVMQVGVYSYAFRHGARVPLEGVSFIAFLGGLIGFVLSFVSIVIFHYLPYEVRSFRRDVFSLPDSKDFVLKHRLKANLIQVAVLLIVGVAYVLLEVAFSFVLLKPEDRADLIVIISRTAAFVGFLMIIALLALNFSTSDSRWQSGLTWIYIGAVLIALYLVLASPFGGFLRAIRYGGGLAVEVTFEDKTSYSGCMFLISDEVITMYESTTLNYVEIPRRDVVRFRYDPVERACELPFPFSPAHKAETDRG